MKRNRYVVSALLVLALMLAGLTAALAQDDDDAPELAQPGFLGITYEIGDDGEVIVMEIMADLPADEAGIESGDIITAIDDEAVTAENIVDVISSYAAGDTITVSVIRDGETLEFEVTLAARPPETMPGMSPGMIIISQDQIEYVADEEAWEIIELNEFSPLVNAGLQAGDLIREINGRAYTPADIDEVFNQMGRRGMVTLTVERDGETLEIDAPHVALMTMFGGMLQMELDDVVPGFMPPELIPRQMPPGEIVPFEVFPPDFPRDMMPGMQQRNPARLGVMFQTIDEALAEGRDLDVTDGALILDVEPDSPAAAAGLQVDDIVIAVEGDALDFRRTLAARLYPYLPGDTVTLDVLRGGEALEIEITLGHWPERAFVPSMRGPDARAPMMFNRGDMMRRGPMLFDRENMRMFNFTPRMFERFRDFQNRWPEGDSPRFRFRSSGNSF